MAITRLLKFATALGAAFGMFVVGGLLFSAGLGALGGFGILPNSYQYIVYSFHVQAASAVFGFLWGWSR